MAEAPTLAATEFDVDRILRSLEARLCDRPIALLPDVAGKLQGFFGGSGFGEDAPPPFEIVDDVAIVSTSGPLIQRSFSMCGFLLADGYDAIEARARAAFESDASAVLHVIDSPGGDCAGGIECIDALASMSAESGKPLVSFADQSAASMGMWLASAASKIVVPRTGYLGAIGVICVGSNIHGALAAEGVRPLIAASPRGKLLGGAGSLIDPADLESMGALAARMQSQVDDMADFFANDIGQRRGKSGADMLALDARMFRGQAAVDVGLADAVGNRAYAIELARSTVKRKVYSMPGNDSAASSAEKVFAQLCGLVGLDPASATVESVEAVSRQFKALADIGTKVLASTGVAGSEAISVVESWKSHALVALPKAREELKAREVQLAVSTGRMTPSQAYAADEEAREYPALPKLHERLAGMSLEAVRRETELAAPLPQTLAPKTAKRATFSGVDPEVVKKAGFASVEEYQAALDKLGPPPGMEISQ